MHETKELTTERFTQNNNACESSRLYFSF